MTATEWAAEYDRQEQFTWNLVEAGYLTAEQYAEIMDRLFHLGML
jgi:hypothetical protein